MASSPSKVARPPWGSPPPFLKALAVAIQVPGSVLVPRTLLFLTYFHRLPLLPLCSAAKHTSGQSPGAALFACEGAGRAVPSVPQLVPAGPVHPQDTASPSPSTCRAARRLSAAVRELRTTMFSVDADRLGDASRGQGLFFQFCVDVSFPDVVAMY